MATAMETDNQNDDDEKNKSNSLDSETIDFNSDYVQIQLAELDILKPARSGYMLFAKLNRDKIGDCGAVSEQSKKIASLWNVLNDEQKEEWNLKVGKQKEKYEQYLDNNPEKKKLLQLYIQHKKLQKSNTHISFPLGTIKRIILRDPDIKRISKESLVLITESTQLFIDSMVKNISNSMTHKTINKKDFIKTLHNQTQYMFVRHVFKENNNNTNNNNNNNKKNSSNEPPKKKPKKNNNGSTITQLFNQKK
eukprot:254397_1